MISLETLQEKNSGFTFKGSVIDVLSGLSNCCIVNTYTVAGLCSTMAQSLSCLFIQWACQSEFGRYRRGNARSFGGSHQQK